MTIHYRTALTAVGPDAADLLDGGILILFADGAPPELAEVSVLHRVAEGPSSDAPRVGATLTIGDVAAELTAIGELAWAKIADMGHVVINFDGAAQGEPAIGRDLGRRRGPGRSGGRRPARHLADHRGLRASAVERRVTVRVKDGLHARPATQFAKLAKTFVAEVELRREGGSAARAKSAVKLMLLGLKEGEEIAVAAAGEDAPQALEALCGFLGTPEAGVAPAGESEPASGSFTGPPPGRPSESAGIPASEGSAIGPAFAFFPEVIRAPDRAVPPEAVEDEVSRSARRARCHHGGLHRQQAQARPRAGGRPDRRRADRGRAGRGVHGRRRGRHPGGAGRRHGRARGRRGAVRPPSNASRTTTSGPAPRTCAAWPAPWR